MVENGERNPEVVKEAMRDLINTMPNMDIDYVEIVDNLTMQSVEKIEGEILCAIAVKVNGEARLIDNFHLKVSSAETDN
jgi:pantoate--beta-alanine ligase